MIWWLLAALLMQSASGPIGKFNDNPPDLEITTQTGIYDVERCLINTTDPLGAPIVYAQPDRPGEAILLWGSGGNTVRRIDLKAVGSGTKVTGWHVGKRAKDCAP
jgi:hypothetical protein